MEKDDKGSTLIRIGVSGWEFLLVPAYPGCPGSKAVKRSLFLRNSPTGQTHRQIFTLDGSNDADSRKGVPFGGFVDIAPHFGDEIPPKNPTSGREYAFSSQMGKYWKFHITETIASISTKLCTMIETTKWSSWVVPIRDPFENPRRPAPQSWKSQRSRYRHNGLTDLYEIWYGDEKMGLLTAPTIKRFDLQKIQHGGWPPFWKLLNHYISATVWPFLMKFGTVVHNSHQNLT